MNIERELSDINVKYNIQNLQNDRLLNVDTGRWTPGGC